MRQLYNLIMDFLVAILNKKADREVIASRRSVCNSCEYKKAGYQLGNTKIINLKRCGVCNCPIKLKTQYYYSDCPKQKW